MNYIHTNVRGEYFGLTFEHFRACMCYEHTKKQLVYEQSAVAGYQQRRNIFNSQNNYWICILSMNSIRYMSKCCVLVCRQGRLQHHSKTRGSGLRLTGIFVFSPINAICWFAGNELPNIRRWCRPCAHTCDSKYTVEFNPSHDYCVGPYWCIKFEKTSPPLSYIQSLSYVFEEVGR